jgi:hypothetical protein
VEYAQAGGVSKAAATAGSAVRWWLVGDGVVLVVGVAVMVGRRRHRPG